MKITRTIEVDPADLTNAELKNLTREQLIKVIKKLQYEVNHAHDYTH